MKHNSSSFTLGFRGIDIPSSDVIAHCIHCGLCLPHCPTFALTGLERSSPRGRIRLIKSVAEGDLPISDTFVEEMNFCLDCQACETACPAGVKYGSLVEAARAQIFTQRKEFLLTRFLKGVLMSWTFREHSRLQALARILRLFERSGLKKILERARLLALVSKKMHALPSLAPSISERFSSDILPQEIRPDSQPQYRVGFLTGCIMDVSYSDVNLDSIELLLRHDCEVVIPKTQGCCGSLLAHSGDMGSAREFAKRNIGVFAELNLDAIVMNSAGCGAFTKDYAHVFQGDPAFERKALDISNKTKDLTEFLSSIGFRNRTKSTNKLPTKKAKPLKGKRLTYHDACHLVHTQKIASQPRELIRTIPGIEFVELKESTWCCGSAGIYNVVRFDDSMKLLERKLQHVRSAQPDIVVTGNPGCVAQLKFGIDQRGLEIDVLHTATLLRMGSET